MIQVSNPRSTIGKYRQVTVGEWNQILEQHANGKGMCKSSEGRTFTRAEVNFILEKYGRVA